MGEWKECKLGDVINYKKGFAFKSTSYCDTGTLIVRISDTTQDSIDITSCTHISDEEASNYEEYRLNQNDVIIATVGSWPDNPQSVVGKVVRVPEAANGALLNQNAVRIRSLVTIMNQTYMYYLLKSKLFSSYIVNNAQGSANQASITLEDIFSFRFLLPDLSEQGYIASVLYSLDDKIDLLHRQNKTLEAMAETLFRQWFVEEADEGQIGQISDLIEFNPTRTLSKGTLAPYLEMANVNTDVFHPNGWYDREFNSGTKFINGDTLLARITPCLENGKSSYVTFLKEGQVGWGSTEFIVMRSKNNLHPLFSYMLCKNTDFRDYAEGCLEGSSGRQRVNVDHLAKFEINIPNPSIIDLFNQVLSAIEPKLHYNFIQIRTLEKIRDTLLPKLMSGEVRVNV